MANITTQQLRQTLSDLVVEHQLKVEIGTTTNIVEDLPHGEQSIALTRKIDPSLGLIEDMRREIETDVASLVDKHPDVVRYQLMLKDIILVRKDYRQQEEILVRYHKNALTY